MNSQISFDNTEIAFKSKSNGELKKAKLLFKSFDYPWLLKWGPDMAKVALNLGMKSVIKNTIFKQFCGGENIDDCQITINRLNKSGIGTILDYSVEGEESESVFISTAEEVIRTIQAAEKQPQSIPFAVFKVTGVIHSDLLEKKTSGKELTSHEKKNWEDGVQRFFNICEAAYKAQVRLFIDAEETWLQDAIDRLAEEAMVKFNQKSTIIYNTLQMYRHDRLEYLKNQIASTTHHLGFKIVRGAYLEKERERAKNLGYTDPIQKTKQDTDRDYNAAVELCLEHHLRVQICIGTHNEISSLKGVELLNKHGLENQHPGVFFSQLLGMSDHISFNLSSQGYNVAKYVPYGPVSAVIPYLTRRAQENSSVAGQMGRELSLIEKELKRRAQA
jgi:proline dehydrogenase